MKSEIKVARKNSFTRKDQVVSIVNNKGGTMIDVSLFVGEVLLTDLHLTPNEAMELGKKLVEAAELKFDEE